MYTSVDMIIIQGGWAQINFYPFFQRGITLVNSCLLPIRTKPFPKGIFL